MIRAVAKEVHKDRHFYFVLAAYAVAAFVFALAVGSAHKFAPLIYFTSWSMGVLFVIGASVTYHAWKSFLTPTPMQTLKERIGAMITPEAGAGIVMLVSLSLLYGVFTSIKTVLPDVGGFFADPFMVEFDAALHGGDPWRRLRWLDPLTPAITFLYANVWSACMVGLAVVATISERLRHLRAQYIWTFMLCWIVLGNVTALAGMSAGPLLYEAVTGDPRFAELVDHLERSDGLGTVLQYRTMLWDAYVHDRVGFGTGISAFPSLHVSMATLFALYARRIHSLLGAAFIAFAGVILLGSVHLGWHYAIDGYFSILATTAFWAAVGWVLNRKGARIDAMATPAPELQT